MKRTVGDVMTRGVIVVSPSTRFKDVARRLASSGVSALPVVDAEGRPLGIVSEADLLPKEDGTRSGWVASVARASRRRAQRKAEAVTARDLMTTPVITIEPEASIAAAARRMQERRVKRLPVLRGGKVVGIVSRQDLVKLFVRPDEEIRDEVEREVVTRTLWLAPHSVRVDVQDGVVTLEGMLETKSLVDILVGLVRGVDGVVGVVQRLSFEFDDTHVRPEGVMPWGLLPPSLRYPAQRRAR